MNDSVSKILRLLLVVGACYGGWWYYQQHQKKVKARELYNGAVKYIEKSEWDKAIDDLEQAEDLGAEDAGLGPDLEKHLGWAYAGKAAEVFKKAEAEKDDDKRGELYEESIILFTKSAKYSKEEAKKHKAHFHIAKAYMERNENPRTSDVEGAKKAIKDADPEDPQVKFLMRRIDAFDALLSGMKALKDKDYDAAASAFRPLFGEEQLANMVSKYHPWYYGATANLRARNAKKAREILEMAGEKAQEGAWKERYEKLAEKISAAM